MSRGITAAFWIVVAVSWVSTAEASDCSTVLPDSYGESTDGRVVLVVKVKGCLGTYENGKNVGKYGVHMPNSRRPIPNGEFRIEKKMVSYPYRLQIRTRSVEFANSAVCYSTADYPYFGEVRVTWEESKQIYGWLKDGDKIIVVVSL